MLARLMDPAHVLVLGVIRHERTGHSMETITSIPIDAITIGERYRQDLGDLTELAESIRQVGLLHPIVITSDNNLVAGQRRLEVLRALGYTDIPCRVIDPELLLRAEHDENTVRKDFTPTEALAIAKALEAYEREQAAARKRAGARRGGRKEGSSNLEEPRKAREARTRAAKATGYSASTLNKVEAVEKAAREYPERFGHLPDEMDRTGRVDRAYRQVVRETESAQKLLTRFVKASEQFGSCDPVDFAARCKHGGARDRATTWAAEMEIWFGQVVEALRPNEQVEEVA